MRGLLLSLLVLLAACNDEADGSFQGYVEGEYVRVAAPAAGWLTSVDVAKGGQAAAGAPLFALDATAETAAVAEAQARLAAAASDLADMKRGARPDEIAAIEAQLADAEANARLAALTLDRQQRLAATQVAAQAQLDSARAADLQAKAQVARVQAQLATARLPARPDRIRAAEANMAAARHVVEQAQWRLGQRRIASPVGGLVDDVVRRIGEWVPAGGVVASLLPPGATKVIFFVPEPQRARLAPGAAVAVACAGCPAGLSARVERIATEAEYTPPVIYSRETRARLSFRVEAALAPAVGAPLPGQPVTVRSP